MVLETVDAAYVDQVRRDTFRQTVLLEALLRRALEGCGLNNARQLVGSCATEFAGTLAYLSALAVYVRDERVPEVALVRLQLLTALAHVRSVLVDHETEEHVQVLNAVLATPFVLTDELVQQGRLIVHVRVADNLNRDTIRC